MNIKPVGTRVLIETAHQERTQSGIYIPESAREGKKEGVVVAVGSDEHGKPLPLQKGARILYGGYSADEFEHNGHTYIIVEYKDVLAVLE